MGWALELEYEDQTKRSVFHIAQRIVLDGENVRVQLETGAFRTYPIEQVRKVLFMRSKRPVVYTDEATDETC